MTFRTELVLPVEVEYCTDAEGYLEILSLTTEAKYLPRIRFLPQALSRAEEEAILAEAAADLAELNEAE